MVLIHRSITVAEEVKYECDLPARLLRVRFPVGANFVNVVCAYQHAWNHKDKTVLDKRAAFWKKLDCCIHRIPNREILILGGDLNVQAQPSPPHVGHGTGRLSKHRAPDTFDFSQLLELHDLTPLNMWGKSGELARTFTFGDHKAQLDYVITRRRNVINCSKKAHPLRNFPVGGWRRTGGYHLPVVASLRAYIPRAAKMPARTSAIDRERIIACSKDPQNPENAALITSLRDKLHSRLPNISKIEDISSLPHLVAEIAGDVFSRHELPTKYQNPVTLVSGITSMWRQWMRIKRSPAACGLREMIHRWKIWTAYNKHQKAHKQRCKARKKQYLIDKMKEAQRASAAMDLRGVFQVVRSLAPKAPRRMTQLRGPQGQMHTRTEEAEIFCEYFGGKFTSRDEWCYQPTELNHKEHEAEMEVGIDADQLTQLLLTAPLRKAVPTGHPPSATWRLCADITANKLEQVINSGWLNAPIRIPQGWSAAYLVLIRKPGKSGKEPEHHRPIGLQDQVGKLVFRHVLEPYVPHIHHQSCTYPQYGHNMATSLAEAPSMLCDVFSNTVARCVKHVVVRGTLSKSVVQEPSPLTGGVQVTVDLAGAFDSIPRQQLLRGMQEIGLPDRVVEVVMEWHCGARYCAGSSR